MRTLVRDAGTVFGSLMGGSLADPCNQLSSRLPLCQPGELLRRSPYLLPCATVGVLSCFAFVIRSVVALILHLVLTCTHGPVGTPLEFHCIRPCLADQRQASSCPVTDPCIVVAAVSHS